MFDIGWPELLLIGVVTLLVVGPKELPRVLRKVMNVVRKARGMAREFQSSLADIVREADLEDIQSELTKAASQDIGTEIENTIDPTGSVGGMFSGDPMGDVGEADETSADDAAAARPDGRAAASWFRWDQWPRIRLWPARVRSRRRRRRNPRLRSLSWAPPAESGRRVRSVRPRRRAPRPRRTRRIPPSGRR